MKNYSSDFDEIRIRKFPLDKKLRLMKMAKEEGQSLNIFLKNYLCDLAELKNVNVLEKKYKVLQEQTLEALKENTEELLKYQKLIKKLIGEN